MAQISISPLPDTPNDGKVSVQFDLSGISPQNEKKASALLSQANLILADGKIDTFEVFMTIGLILNLQKL